MADLKGYVLDMSERVGEHVETAQARKELVESQATALSTEMGGFDSNKDFVTYLRRAAEQHACIGATLRRAQSQLEYYADRI